jgi:hypothetical protein
MQTSNGQSVAWQLETDMKRKVLLIGGIAATTLLVGGWALAQSAGHGHRGMGPGAMGGMHGHMGQGMHDQMGQGMHGRMGQHMRGRMGQSMMHGGPAQTFADPASIDTLKTELGITAAQEPAWSKYTKAVQDAASAARTTRETVDREAVSRMTPADRFAFVSKMREQRLAQFDAVKTAAEELLATLDDTQKAKARETLPGLAFGPGTMRGAGLGGPQHRH